MSMMEIKTERGGEITKPDSPDNYRGQNLSELEQQRKI